jgi:hypothetical protein
MAGVHMTVSHQMSHSDPQNPVCQVEIDRGIRGIIHQQVRKPLFCNRIRPRAPLARLIEKRSLSGLSQVRDGQPNTDERPTFNIERPTSKYSERRAKVQ